MSEVNTYKAIGFLMTFLPEPAGDYMKAAQSHLRELADAYNALAPDWSNAPEWAQWVTIFDNGKRIWGECEPNPYMDDRSEYAWIEKDRRTGMATSEKVDPLPIGIDWRLCKWQRPEVTK